jgi:hypothetical protein
VVWRRGRWTWTDRREWGIAGGLSVRAEVSLLLIVRSMNLDLFMNLD